MNARDRNSVFNQEFLSQYSDEERFDAWEEAMSELLGEAVMMIEVLGSAEAVEATGWFDDQPPALYDLVIESIPVSRGGLCDDRLMNLEYEKMVDELYRMMGREKIDQMRKEVEDLLDESRQTNDEQADSPAYASRAEKKKHRE